MKSWSMVGLAALQVSGLGLLYAWSVLINPVQDYFGVDRTATSLVFSVSIAVFSLSVMLAPRLFAGWRLLVVGALACFVGSAGLILAAHAPTFTIFVLAYGGLFAAASGLGYSAGVQMAVVSGVARTGLAAGVIIAAFAAGAVILGPLMGNASVMKGLTAALYVPAALLAVIGFMSVLVLHIFSNPAMAFPSGEPPDRHATGLKPTYHRRLAWLLWLGFATGAAGGLMVLGHAAGIIAEQNGSVAMAGIAVSMIAVGNALGRISSGAISDWLGPRTVLLLAVLMLGGATGVMALSVNSTISVIALAAVGMSYGIIATGYPVAVHQFYGPERFATIYGWVFTAWGVAGLIAPLLAGRLYDVTGGYQLALLVATVSSILSVLIVLLFPRRSVKLG